MEMSLKNKVGPWVVGDEFWDRKTETERLMALLGEGENLLIVAPRRIGKTSLVRESLRQMAGRNRDIGLFVDVQDCSGPEEVIVAISIAIRQHQKIWLKILGVFSSFLGNMIDKIDEISIDKITLKIRESVAGDWQAKGTSILETLAGAEHPVVLALDELPVMVNRMLRPKANRISEGSIQQTEVFLSWLRMTMGKYQGRIRWIVCGSIGLEPILSQCRLNHTIGHLRSFHLSPWENDVADGCLQALANHSHIALPEAARQKMLALLGCNIPQYVQMFFGYVKDHCLLKRITQPGPEDIQWVYDQYMLSTRGHAELADLEERLHRVLGQELVVLAFDLLTETSVEGVLTDAAAWQLGEWNQALFQPMDAGQALRLVMGVLEHDGYLRSKDTKGYQFVSNLVRDWWKRRFQLGYTPAKERRR
ncbi:MAG: ATP-binding protein [Pseudomonadota bacterium]